MRLRGRLLPAGAFRRWRILPAVALLAWALLLQVPAALGHANLVSSEPGAGEVLATAPVELRLVFSEPIDASYTNLDLLGGTGRVLLANAGSVDPSDPRVLVVRRLPTLGSGAYTISWRSVSASDGHTMEGFIGFGVGSVTLPAGEVAQATEAGTLHAGHGGLLAAVDVLARTLSDGGTILAFGLWVFGALVLRPLRGRPPSALVLAQAGALAAGAVGAALQALVTYGSLPVAASAAGAGLATYLTTSRTAILFASRCGLELVGAEAALAASRWWRVRPAVASAGAGVVGLAGIVLIALGGHAAGFGRPGPLILDSVHLAAAGTWLAGLIALAALAVVLRRRSPELPSLELRALVPRFSALALLTGGLLAATGLVADWDLTHSFVSLSTDYGRVLALKIALVAAAFAVGAVNLWDGGRDARVVRVAGRGARLPRVAGTLSVRLVAESLLLIGVLIATANITSGSPPAEGAPLQLAPAVSSVPATTDARLYLAPASAGPNQAWVAFTTAPPAGAMVLIELARLDESTGTSRIKLSAAPAPPTLSDAAATYSAGGLVLAPSSRWDASVLVDDAAGQEIGRERFSFAFSGGALSAGWAPEIDPVWFIGLVLLVVGAALGGYCLAGGRAPWVEPTLGRLTIVAASVLGLALGAVIVFGGG